MTLTYLVMAMATTPSLPQKRKEGIAYKKRRVVAMVMTNTLSLPEEEGGDSLYEEEGCMVMTTPFLFQKEARVTFRRGRWWPWLLPLLPETATPSSYNKRR